MLNLKLLKEICETPGVPGYEQPVRELVLRELEGLADEVTVDNMGNIHAVRKGKGAKKVMASAHMDEIGFIVTHVDDRGFLRFTPLGGFDPKTLTSQRVIVHGKKPLLGVMGSKPVHLMSPGEREKAVAIKDFFIDLGLPGEEVKKLVSVGDVVTRDRELAELGDCVNCKSLDNRICVYILLETLRALRKVKLSQTFVAVFSVQEEVGLRGANAATLKVQPDFAFGLDTTIAFDTPGATPGEEVTKLGQGSAIKIMDSSVICDFRMVDFMKKTAAKHKIKWQPEILPAGGTDTASLQRMTPGGSIAGAVSVPTRHIHQVIETCHKEDVVASIDLLAACVRDIDTYDWSFRRI